MKASYLFYYKGEFLYDQPKHTVISKVKYFGEEKGDVAVCVRQYNFPYYLGFLLIVGLLVAYYQIKPATQTFVYKDTMYVQDNTIGLDITNTKGNVCPIMLNLTYNGSPLIETQSLKPEDTVGSVPLRQELEKGSYMCKLEYTINIGIRHLHEAYDVLVIVE